MKYQKITIEVPALTDEAAAYLHKFIEALMYAVDEYYYRQIYLTRINFRNKRHACNMLLRDENKSP